MNDYRWSLGTLIGLPIAGFFALVCLGWIVLCLIGVWVERKTDPGPPIWGAGIGGLGLIITVLITVGCYWPFKAEYHQWRTESGAVTAVNSRLLADGQGGATQRFVVTLDGERQRSCDDTRCAQVEVGDVLTLACKRAWQWSGTHGYDCNFIDLKEKP